MKDYFKFTRFRKNLKKFIILMAIIVVGQCWHSNMSGVEIIITNLILTVIYVFATLVVDWIHMKNLICLMVVISIFLSGCQKQITVNEKEIKNNIDVIWSDDERIIKQDNTLMNDETMEEWKNWKVQYWDVSIGDINNQCSIDVNRIALFGKQSDAQPIQGWEFEQGDSVLVSFEVTNSLYGFDIEKMLDIGYLYGGQKVDVPFIYENNSFETYINIPDDGNYCFYIQNKSSAHLDVVQLKIISE